MDRITLNALQGAAGVAGGDKVYVEEVFSTFLYDGTGSTQSINNGIDLDGEGGLVWIKERNIGSHQWYDTERGRNSGYISSHNNNQEYDMTTFTTYGLTSFNSNGFSLGTDWNDENPSDQPLTSWTFRKAPGFFDVVTYEGDDVAGREIAHSLGSVPGMIIIKETDGTEDWRVYHRSLGGTKNLRLNQTYIAGTGTAIFNDTDPTSSVFTVGTDPATNGDGKNFVAYLFAHDDQQFGEDEDESIIKCGSYTGTGSTNNFIDLGWEPQFYLVKCSSHSSTDWIMVDSMRGAATGANDAVLLAHLNNSEITTDNRVDFTSTGFFAGIGGNDNNASGRDYIYMAIRRPHKKPEAVTEVFDINTRTGNETERTSNAGFPVDMAIIRSRNLGGWTCVFDRKRGINNVLVTSEINDEATYNNSLIGFDSMTAIKIGTDSHNVGVNRNSITYVDYLFKRAPGFFDVVCYDGTGSARTVSHNLGVTPELMLIKRCDGDEAWAVYVNGISPTKMLELNVYNSAATLTGRWDNTAPTSSVFTVESHDTVNGSDYAYIAYLFATLPGISKVGSYTGTGNDIDVDCGFTNGARFVMVKRTDDNGDWYVWDTERGITAGDDPHLLLNDTDAEVDNNSNIDPHNPGFQITDDAPDALNESGGEYIYLAIA